MFMCYSLWLDLWLIWCWWLLILDLTSAPKSYFVVSGKMTVNAETNSPKLSLARTHSHPAELIDFWPCLRRPAVLAQSCPSVTVHLCEFHQSERGRRDSQTNTQQTALQRLPVDKQNLNCFYRSKPVKHCTFYGKLASRCVFTIWSGVFCCAQVLVPVM